MGSISVLSTSLISYRLAKRGINPNVLCRSKTCGLCRPDTEFSPGFTIHKAVHNPNSVVNDGEQMKKMGKEWIATRDLAANTILLEEFPILQGPEWTFLDPAESGFGFGAGSPNCLTCGVQMESSEMRDRRCIFCLWPVCSTNCEEHSTHKENECEILMRRKISYPPQNIPKEDLALFILLLRASALKSKQRRKFDRLMRLQDFCSIPSSNQQLFEAQFSEEILQLLDCPNSMSEEELKKIWRIIKINSFESDFFPGDFSRINSNLNSGNRMKLIFLKMSRMNHSCSPNCHFSFGPAPNFKARIRTSRPVRKGEPLTIFYYEWCDFLPTLDRQREIRTVGGFQCQCPRCLDPSELGSFINAFKCSAKNCGSQKQKNNSGEYEMDSGYFIPAPPLSWSKNPLFKCNSCQHMKFYATLKSTLPLEIQQIFDEIKTLDLNENTKENRKTLEKMLRTFGKNPNFLHKNHWLIQYVTRTLIRFLSEMSLRKMDKRNLEKISKRAQYLLEIDEKLFPGVSRQKGDDLRVLARASHWLVLCHSAKLNRGETEKWLQICQKAQEEAFEFFKMEPSDFVLDEIAEKLLKEMRTLRENFQHWN